MRWCSQLVKTSSPPPVGSVGRQGSLFCLSDKYSTEWRLLSNRTRCLGDLGAEGTIIWEQLQEMGLLHLKTFMPQRLIMCTVLEPFTKLDSVSSWWIPSKDRLMEIHWNGQKASLWQEAMGNTETGTQAHRNRGCHPGWPVGICLCLLFALVSGFHFSLVYHVKDVLLQGSRGQVCYTNRRPLYL